MRKLGFSLVILLVLFACKNNKTLKGDKPVGATQFFDAYEKLKLPFTVTDSTLKEAGDTNTISYTIFTQFISDTIFNKPFGKERKLTIHPVGKFEQKGKESYFVTLVNSKNLSALYLSVYDSNKHMATLPLLATNPGDGTINTATIDNKLSIILSKDWTVKNDPFYNRTIYAYNNVGIFTTVLTETNDQQKGSGGILNPLDTFPKLRKYSGDYTKDAKNVVYIRDGNAPDTYLFFVHFDNEKEDDPCDGELRGQLKMNSEKTGVYTGTGDPCVLDFSFKNNQVQVKETGSCGNYRGIRCFFNDTYTKRKRLK
ncbi:MAG TPA: hypothetical protein VF623_15315 [Segetibacter sp.]